MSSKKSLKLQYMLLRARLKSLKNILYKRKNRYSVGIALMSTSALVSLVKAILAITANKSADILLLDMVVFTLLASGLANQYVIGELKAAKLQMEEFALTAIKALTIIKYANSRGIGYQELEKAGVIKFGRINQQDLKDDVLTPQEQIRFNDMLKHRGKKRIVN